MEEKEKTSSSKKHVEAEARRSKRAQEDLDWERKRSLLLGSIESSQV